MNETIRSIPKKFGICLIFSFDLFVLVWLSEMLRDVMLTSIPVSLIGAMNIFLWIFVIVPLILLSIWLFNPLAIKKLFVTFGLTEEQPEKKNITKNAEPEETEQEKLKLEFQHRRL